MNCREIRVNFFPYSAESLNISTAIFIIVEWELITKALIYVIVRFFLISSSSLMLFPA